MTKARLGALTEAAAHDLLNDIYKQLDKTGLTGEHTFEFEVFVGEVPEYVQMSYGLNEPYAACVYAGELGTWFFIPSNGDGAIEQVWLHDVADRIFDVFAPGGVYGKETA